MQNQVNEIVKWIGLADSDYIAARTLIRAGLVMQGVILASSAVEKYLKTVHLIFNRNFEDTHNIVNLYNQLKDVYDKKPLNESYLRILNKTYKVRYPDRLEKEFSIALHQGKMLVGLDETVFGIRNRIKIAKIESPKTSIELQFDQRIKYNDEQLLQGNHSFGSANRQEAFKVPLIWYEMKVLKDGAWLEASYLGRAKDDGRYELGGLRSGKSNRQFILQSPIETL